MALSNRGAFERKEGCRYFCKPERDATGLRDSGRLGRDGGRAAARVLKGNTAALRDELETMRAAFVRLDLDSFVEHDIAFHRNILEASQNEVLLRVWDSLAIDLRIRAAVGKISGDFPELVESHRPILDALEMGRGREAGTPVAESRRDVLGVSQEIGIRFGIPLSAEQRFGGRKGGSQSLFPPTEPFTSWYSLRDLLSAGSRHRWRLLRFSSLARRPLGNRHWRCLRQGNQSRLTHGQPPGLASSAGHARAFRSFHAYRRR